MVLSVITVVTAVASRARSASSGVSEFSLDLESTKSSDCGRRRSSVLRNWFKRGPERVELQSRKTETANKVG